MKNSKKTRKLTFDKFKIADLNKANKLTGGATFTDEDHNSFTSFASFCRPCAFINKR
ncbi:hypothetical protein ACJD0Z_02850 [Flavobacteriaceae bacterium M23B6Z8]